jgi:hypothetical protein
VKASFPYRSSNSIVSAKLEEAESVGRQKREDQNILIFWFVFDHKFDSLTFDDIIGQFSRLRCEIQERNVPSFSINWFKSLDQLDHRFIRLNNEVFR